MRIAHLADVHIRNNERHEEYREVFSKIYKKLKELKPDRILIVGDLFENFIEISNEAKILGGEFLNNLSKISEVIITRGNHDLRKKNLNRIDSIKVVVELIDNPKITYYDVTGIYKDGNFSWVVYDHADKLGDPWVGETKDKEQIYIGLFHDPIDNCTNDFGKVFTSSTYRAINDFRKNDFVFLGDIHKRQYFRKNKSAAYCGSTIQQNFGEKVDGHGFIIWDINSKSDFTTQDFDIENEWTRINLYIDEGEDYDNLILSTDERIGKYPEFKVHWKDLSSNINTENERKIRDFIKNKYGTNKVKFDKTYVYTDIVSSQMLSESLDLSSKDTQRKIFKEYLEEQGYKKEDIDEILKIDDIVNDRLELKETKTNIEWKIDKFWFDNFRAFGDKNKINWEDVNGVIQIHGENQQGKTTILDAITYILYGTTLTTDKREKFGDNRYINNKRKLDKCSGGAVLDVDGEKITIVRKTERKWNRSKTELTSCSTNLDYYSSDEIKEKNKLTGERRNKTQEKLDIILGDFKDFVRISLTNADNLNELLSADRSIFIDSIIKDAGYDIFEKKLKEYKEYKKEQNVEKIIVDVSESEVEISEIKENILEKKSQIKNRKSQISDYELELENKGRSRDNLIKSLNKIDESMVNFDVDLSNETLQNYNKKIEDNKIQIAIYEREIKDLPTKFEPSKLEELRTNLKETNNKISKLKEEISTVKSGNNEIETKVDKVKQKLREFRDSEIRKFQDEINKLEKEISSIESERQQIINSKILSVKDEIKKVELEKINLENKVKSLKKDGSVLKSRNDEKELEIEELKNSKFCPTCGRDYDESTPEHLEHIQQKIDKLENDIKENNIKIKELISEYKELNPKVPQLEEEIYKLKEKRDKLLSGDYDSDIIVELDNLKNTTSIEEEIENYKSLIERLKSNDLSVNEELKNKFNKGKMLLKKLDENKNNNILVIKNLDNELKLLNVDSIEDDIYQEEKIKSAYELRKEKINQKEKLILNIDNYKLKIKDIEQSIDKFKQYEKQIEENKGVQDEIDDIDIEISTLKTNIGEEYNEISNLKREIALQEKEVETISSRIDKYIQQKKQEELMKEYQRCISRDGIPTYLLKKSIHLINRELNDLLTNVDFTLFFDDNLILRMSMDDRLDVSQNAIESSGKERTFCALALKIALRQINVKSRPNFIILDEIMGKLVDNSVIEFIDLLDEIKNKISKIVIIEHVHPINYDGLITVKKDDKLVSSLTTDF